MDRTCFRLCCCLLLVSNSWSLRADTFEWTDPVSGDFSTAGNWTNTTGVDAAPPNAGDSALFNEPVGTYSVNFVSDQASDELLFMDGLVSFTSTGGPHTYQLTTGNADANISGGQLNLAGTHLNIGDDFNVLDAAFFSNGGNVTVGGVASIATSGGNAAAIFDNATIDFQGLVRLGLSGFQAGLTLQNGSIGTIGGNLDFARSGTLGSGGILNVNSGSTLTTNGQILLGDILSNGTPNYTTLLTVDGTGAAAGATSVTMNGANNLRVGDSMFDNVQAELTVNNGGVFSTSIGGGNTIVQRTGVLTVESGGTFNARHDLQVTQGGTVNITDGTLNTDALFSIDAASSVTLDGGAINANAGLDNSAGGTLNHLDGTLTVTGGALVPVSSGHYFISGSGGGTEANLVLGSGATTTIELILQVADVGNGRLEINSGGQATSASGRVGDISGIALPISKWTGRVLISGTDGFATPSTWTVTGDLFVGSGGTGILDVDQGGQVISDTGTVGSSLISPLAGSVYGRGTATIDGAGSNWTMTGDLSVTRSGGSVSTLNIQNGATVSNASSTVQGTVNVDGSSAIATWQNNASMVVGNTSSGSVGIHNGGVVSSNDATLGSLSGSSGAVVVAGADGGGNPSTWTNTGVLRVGDMGSATLTISGGAIVSTASAMVAVAAGSTANVSVTGADSSWTTSADLYVGGSDLAAGGTAGVTIQDQALVDVATALRVWNDGTVTIDGGTLRFDSTQLTLDGQLSFLSGRLHLTDVVGFTVGANTTPVHQLIGGSNAVLTTGQGLLVDNGLTIPATTSLHAIFGSSIAIGTTLINDGFLLADTTPLVTQTGLINNTDLALADTTVDGPVVNSTGAAITVFGTVDFNGLVSGPGNFYGPGTANFNGGLSIGASPAEVNFEGSVALASSNDLLIELGGLLAGGEFDRLTVDGSVSLGGTLDVSFINGFTPSAGDSFEIITAASVLNTFDTVNLPGLPGDLFWYLNYTPTSVELVSTYSADFDEDGDVDDNDLAAWQGGFGSGLAVHMTGDANANAVANGFDFLAWQSQFGTGIGAPLAEVTATPEPTSLALLLLGLGLTGLGKRRA